MTNKEVAEATGVACITVRKWAKRLGVSRRAGDNRGTYEWSPTDIERFLEKEDGRKKNA